MASPLLSLAGTRKSLPTSSVTVNRRNGTRVGSPIRGTEMEVSHGAAQ